MTSTEIEHIVVSKSYGVRLWSSVSFLNMYLLLLSQNDFPKLPLCYPFKVCCSHLHTVIVYYFTCKPEKLAHKKLILEAFSPMLP